MFQVYLRELKSNLKGLLFWCLGMTVMGCAGFYEYSGIVNSGESISQMFNMMPRIVLVMFGAGTLSLDTPEGYFACMMLWLGLIAFSHAVLLGASIISKEERDKTAEFLFVKPITRTTVVTAKILAGIKNITIVNLVALITAFISFLPFVEGVDLLKEVILSMVGMYITSIVFLFIGLFISGICKEHKKASMFAGVVVLVSYFISVFIEMAKIEFLDFLSPFRYFNAVGILENGINPWYLLLSLGIIIVTGMFTYRLWHKKDLNN